MGFTWSHHFPVYLTYSDFLTSPLIIQIFPSLPFHLVISIHSQLNRPSTVPPGATQAEKFDIPLSIYCMSLRLRVYALKKKRPTTLKPVHFKIYKFTLQIDCYMACPSGHLLQRIRYKCSIKIDWRSASSLQGSSLPAFCVIHLFIRPNEAYFTKVTTSVLNCFSYRTFQL